MPWPDFSELSFGYGFLREFERLHTAGGSFPAAPDFISQAVEATKGYDVKVLKNSTPVYFQFKRSFVLTTANAGEIKKGDFNSTPLFRMHLRERDSYRQHKALQQLETSGEAVFYVTSQIESADDLSRCYTNGNVLSTATAVIAPNEIVLPNTTKKHHVTFKADGNTFRLYSEEGEGFERKVPNWQRLLAVLSNRRRSTPNNRDAIERTVQLLSSRSHSATEVADRFKDPVVRASVLAFLVLDAQLIFFKS
ncbi:hypothetical protein FJW07_31450 [Mesorhizobium sp. B3-1-9]|uniref:hypothetical protein n=1 Tax=Mesorhizobium sp. B3-1-9 TaxID=2589892 RepID=UPI00112915EB|nr:hypothetical protein [Mesorhizobium sp. B3-1-9]TPI27330.1 hypothetical protein FJW07_31450 [Mesorhizobium sp. B3-1-9]